MTENETHKHEESLPENPQFSEELDRLLNNGVSRNTPQYDLINIDRVC